MQFSDMKTMVTAAVVASSIVTGLFYLYTWAAGL